MTQSGLSFSCGIGGRWDDGPVPGTQYIIRRTDKYSFPVILKPVAPQSKTLLRVATLSALLICGYAAFQWNQHRLLTLRSHVVEEHLKHLLAQSRDSAPIEKLLPSDLVGAEDVALVAQ
jgi:hypothetical protein